MQKHRIQKWREDERRDAEEKKSYLELVEFQKRQEFAEKLPLLKEAAARREKIRQVILTLC